MELSPNTQLAARSFRSCYVAVISIVFSVLFLSGCVAQNWQRANLNSTAWGQTSEEYRALALGSYGQAQRMLDVALTDPDWTATGQKLPGEDEQPLPPAVILDIDETALDNQQFQAWVVKNNIPYSPPIWNQWVSEMKAAAVPGALAFVRYARSKGVKVFFVTNRDFEGEIHPATTKSPLKEFTVRNLKDAGLLPAEGTEKDSCVYSGDHLDQDDSVLLKKERAGWGSDKTSRRKLIANCYRVVLLLGDVLGDFIGYKKNDNEHLDFYRENDTGLNSDQRRKALRPYEQNWGTRWILLPNPRYGSWERALYNFEDGLAPKDKGQRVLNALTAWSSDKPNHLRCHVVVDVGTTGTRLYIYYKRGGKWIEEKGPKTEKGLAKELAEELAEGVTNHKIVDDVVKLLGKFESFDWKDQCSDVDSIQVLATAGMRLAEKADPDGMETFWKSLRTGLHKAYGQFVDWPDITTKTITGYEEGIYAWLSIKKEREQNALTDIDFGVVEMGGGSTQVTFPCGIDCTKPRDFVVDNKTVPFSVHSFLGLGTDELPKSIGFTDIPTECKYGFGALFVEKACSDPIDTMLISRGKIKDPHLNRFIATPDRNHIAKWYRKGSFYYMDKELRDGNKSDVSNCCENSRDQFCYERLKSCFVTMYRPVFLGALGINYKDTAKVIWDDSSWTLGALICEETDCLQKISTRTCPWLTGSMCLAPPAKP